MTPKPVKLNKDFYTEDVLVVAPSLLGKTLVVDLPGCGSLRYMITEVEAYRGEEDKACHAAKGRTKRTEVMYSEGGRVYVYFVYGMYWMLNIVTGREDDPQAVLIRGLEGINGPGRLTKKLSITGDLYGEDLTTSQRIWIEDNGIAPFYKTTPRIGIGYSGEPWILKPWRFIIEKK